MMSLTVTTNAAQDPKSMWITPDAQLNKFAASTTIYTQIIRVTTLDLNVSAVVASYLLEGNLIDWYTMLRELKRLPEKIPPAPATIHKKLAAASSKHIAKSSQTIDETCTLSLVAEELGTANEMEKAAIAYGKTVYPARETPLKFHFLEKEHMQYGNAFPETSYWQLETNTVLENSRDKWFENQEALVKALSAETHELWAVPNLRGSYATFLVRKIAGKAIHYEVGHANNKYCPTYTRLQEMTGSLRLTFGGSDSSCVRVHVNRDSNDYRIGVGAQQKLIKHL
jgi:hypothetical protein